MGLEVFINHTSTLHMSLWQAPTRWIGIGTSVDYITWNLASWEEPDPDIFRSPLHCVYATADCIETRSETGRSIVTDSTANIVARLEIVSSTQPVRRRYSHNMHNWLFEAGQSSTVYRLRWYSWDCCSVSTQSQPNCNSLLRMQCHAIMVHQVDSFHNINLSIVWPVRSQGPDYRQSNAGINARVGFTYRQASCRRLLPVSA